VYVRGVLSRKAGLQANGGAVPETVVLLFVFGLFVL
jgi:hypothetical protein